MSELGPEELSLAHCPLAIAVTDAARVLRFVNLELCALFGYSGCELLGRSLDDLLAPAFRHDHAGPLPGVVGGSDSSARRQPARVAGLRRDGSEFPVELVSKAHQTSAGPRWVTAISDASEHSLAEQAARAQKEELERSNAELVQFAYVASHDLQEPLRMVVSYAELLSQRYQGRLDERADRFIRFAVEGATRLQQMVTDLLAYSRVGTQGLRRFPVDGEHLVSSTVRALEVLVAESGAEITWGALPVIYCDQIQLSQLLQNLLINAIKFRRDTPPRIQISAGHKDSAVVLAIADNGIGIDARHAHRIFEMFQRLNDREQYDGSGLGLAIAKKVAERHGGRIWFESTPGVGSTFFVQVPDGPTQ